MLINLINGHTGHIVKLKLSHASDDMIELQDIIRPHAEALGWDWWNAEFKDGSWASTSEI